MSARDTGIEDLNPETLTERILHLETSNVGCGPVCSCRAFLGMTLSPQQAERLKQHATKVTFDKAPTDTAIVRGILGDTIDYVQDEVLNQLASDRGDLSAEDIKGGKQGAEMSVMKLFKFSSEMLVISAFLRGDHRGGGYRM